jgi:hypothetical protein
MAERVNHPPHYNAGGIECIDALEDGAQVEYAWCKYVGKPMMGLRGDER